MKPRLSLSAAAVMAACALASGALLAQDKSIVTTPDREIGETPTQGPEGLPPRPGPAPGRAVRPGDASQPSDDQRKPIQVGSFLLYPELVANWMYDSNVFYTNRAIGDHATIFSPAVWLQSNWTQHALNFYGSADITSYNTYTVEDTTDWRVAVEGRYDFNPDTNVYGGYRHGREHQDRESPDNRNGIKPTIYYQDRAYAGFFKQFDKISVRIGGTWQHLDYEDTPFITTTGTPRLINNDDRDRSQYTGGVRVGYEISPRIEPYVQVALDNRRYDNQPDDGGFYRNSNGGRYLAGVRWNVPKKLKLDAFAGYMNQNYDDARLQSVSTPAFGASLVWAALTNLTLSGYLDRTIEETTLTQTLPSGDLVSASSYTNSYLSVGANYRLTGNWVLQGNVSYSEAKYNGLPRTDDYYGFGGSVIYKLSKNAYIDLSYAYRNLHSSVPTENFIKRQTFLGIAFPISN